MLNHPLLRVIPTRLMETRHHIHEEPFEVSPERMFDILITPAAIRRWWGASKVIVVPQKSGTWMAAWGEDENNPEYISTFTIKEIDPPHRLVLGDGRYQAHSGEQPFEMNMTAEFTVDPREEGCTLKVVNDGFPIDESADEFYDACLVGWKNTFDGIRKYFYDLGTELKRI